MIKVAQKGTNNCNVFLYLVCSKVVSVDHNKPIIVPAGQDSLSQIGENVFTVMITSLLHMVKTDFARPRVLIQQKVYYFLLFCWSARECCVLSFSLNIRISNIDRFYKYLVCLFFNLKPVCTFLPNTAISAKCTGKQLFLLNLQFSNLCRGPLFVDTEFFNSQGLGLTSPKWILHLITFHCSQVYFNKQGHPQWPVKIWEKCTAGRYHSYHLDSQSWLVDTTHFWQVMGSNEVKRSFLDSKFKHVIEKIKCMFCFCNF